MISEISRLRNRAGNGVIAPLPGHVEDSWQRCLETYNLSPDLLRPTEMLTWHELQSRLEQYEAIVHFAQPEIERLFQRLVDNEYMVSLASSEGVMLMFRCDHHFLGEMSNFRVLPGSNWSEEIQGTNGIGTCLKTGKSLSIIGEQHFNTHVHALSCSVAPIFGKGGAINGVVNVTSSRPVNDKTARLVCDIVERAARRIENRYFADRNRHLRTLCLSLEQDFTDIAAEARVAVDDTGRIVDVSQNTPALLNHSREALVGTDLGSLMDLDLPLEGGRIRRTELPDRNGRAIFARLLPESEAVRGTPGPATRQSAKAPSLPSPPALPGTPPGRRQLHPHLVERLAVAQRMLAAHVPVLVQGETGVGKSTFAALLAGHGGRGEGNVMVLNCAVLTGEDEALDRLSRLSHFTLVLDHVEETSRAAQARLLQLLSDDHLLQSRDIGLVSIAGCDLAKLEQEGRLRADLYHRLKGVVINLDPLRATPGLDAQIQTVFAEEAQAQGKHDRQLDETARLVLSNYHWPGNLRELRQAARHAAILVEGDRIGIGQLPAGIVSEIAHDNLSARSQSEASRIEAALRHNGGNVSETARYLGISRATLYRKIQIRNLRVHDA